MSRGSALQILEDNLFEFLKPTGESHAITIDDAQFTVVEVEPRM